MSDSDRLPSNWARAFAGAASASDAVTFMMMLHNPEWHGFYTHFLGDALPGEWAAAQTNGTAAAVTVASSQLTLTTGTDDDGYAGQGYGMFWTGDNGIYMASEQSIDTLTTSKLEIGFTDAVDDAGAVATKATPTGTADDFAVLVRDTDDNTDLDLISEIDNAGPVANAEGVHTVVGATTFLVELRAQNDAVSAGVAIGTGAAKGVSTGTTADASMQGGTLVTPWWFAQARAGTASRVMTVEWAVCLGPVA